MRSFALDTVEKYSNQVNFINVSQISNCKPRSVREWYKHDLSGTSGVLVLSI